jgi:hypothetical protein
MKSGKTHEDTQSHKKTSDESLRPGWAMGSTVPPTSSKAKTSSTRTIARSFQASRLWSRRMSLTTKAAKIQNRFLRASLLLWLKLCRGQSGQRRSKRFSGRIARAARQQCWQHCRKPCKKHGERQSKRTTKKTEADAPAKPNSKSGIDLAAWARGQKHYLAGEVFKALRNEYHVQLSERRDAVDFLIAQGVIEASQARTDV